MTGDEAYDSRNRTQSRATTAAAPKRRRPKKRSASFEKQGRPTLIQEMLAGGTLIEEEQKGEDTD